MGIDHADIAPERWLEKQVSMVKFCSVSNTVGQVACVSAIYWYLSAFANHSIWWRVGLVNAALIVAVPYWFFRSDSSASRKLGVHAHNLLCIFIPLIWLYPTAVAYEVAAPSDRAVYSIVLAGMAAAGVSTIPNNPRLATAILWGFLLPFAIVSLRIGGEYGTTMSILAIVYGAVLTSQVYVVQSAQRHEFLLAEHNKALLAENERNAQSLVHASRMAALGQMAGGVAHEINNPLAILTLEIAELRDILKLPSPDGDALAESLDNMEFTIERISRIVVGMLAISRDESSQVELISASGLVDDVLGVCSERVRQLGIRIRDNRDSDTFPDVIECNRGQVGQVLLNLVNNAVDAMLEAGIEKPWIDIRFLGGDDTIVIQVEDGGLGLGDAIADRVFEPFFTTKPIGSGTGLGLSISKGLIEAQGGHLRLCRDSEYTCFEIVLPRRDALGHS